MGRPAQVKDMKATVCPVVSKINTHHQQKPGLNWPGGFNPQKYPKKGNLDHYPILSHIGWTMENCWNHHKSPKIVALLWRSASLGCICSEPLWSCLWASEVLKWVSQPTAGRSQKTKIQWSRWSGRRISLNTHIQWLARWRWAQQTLPRVLALGQCSFGYHRPV